MEGNNQGSEGEASLLTKHFLDCGCGLVLCAVDGRISSKDSDRGRLNIPGVEKPNI